MTGFDERVAHIAEIATDAIPDRRPDARIMSIRDGAEIEDDAFADARRRSLAEAREELWQRRIPRRFHTAATFDFDGSARRDLESWVTGPRGQNLVLFGPVGVGKSRAAVAACRSAHDQSLDVAFWPTADLLDAMRPGDDAVRIDDIADLDRLILDDVGVERMSDWTVERLDSIINRRWMDELPTIVTTNLAPADLEVRVGQRAFSRLLDTAVVVRLAGSDRRRT